ncbi:MAG TPA: tripartite tricarboxylate transporter substrate-binding protein [Usitatibacteraceae bacterium]|nr:tripartite tricarboxylate transporter substrate-binding protein [Usitatibacteraceae bacterium]
MARLSRHSLLRAAALAAGISIAGSAFALDSVKMMIPANPGGGWDTTGRELGKALLASGAVKNIQYDNKGGAAGAIGLAQFVSASKGDPNALMMGGMVMVGGTIQNKSAVTLDQVTPVARLTSEYEVIVVPAASPIKDMKDLMAKFKANPGSISWGGGSAGGTDHILAGLLAKEVGVEPGKVNYVPFKGGGEAVAAIIGGHVSAGISGLSEFSQHIQSGKMRALAISSAKTMDKIPSLKEQGFNVELANWRGIFGAPGISKAQQAELVKAVETATKHKSWEDSLKRQEWSNFWLPGDEYGAFVQSEVKRIGEILAGLNLGKK